MERSLVGPPLLRPGIGVVKFFFRESVTARLLWKVRCHIVHVDTVAKVKRPDSYYEKAHSAPRPSEVSLHPVHTGKTTSGALALASTLYGPSRPCRFRQCC